MLLKIKKAIQLVGNMGWRYITFRTGFELQKKTGLLKKKFPLNPLKNDYYTLEAWRLNARPFFFNSREELSFDKKPSPELIASYNKISAFNYPFFSSTEYNLGADFDWMTNPDSGFKYDADLHWLDINDYDKKSGDIKFVWEPSRFSHLYTLIRYDKHSGQDCAKQVFKEIERWLDANKINQGPNFKCSQEISLRVMNWTFALYYYKNSPYLTEELFSKIQHYIYWQVLHVYHNINFSRIAVRNNHAITETLLLYFAGTLFPQFPGAEKWKKDGKRWFEQEVAYQVYEDGTFLQFSMNYHRVVIQLFNWAIRLAEVNNDRFNDVVYNRAEKSLSFLVNVMNENTGWLPNYGNNDGALFFKLNDAHYRDYRPQLEALSNALGLEWKYEQFEDTLWYGLKQNERDAITITQGYHSYPVGGFHIFRQPEALAFLRCGNHNDRPAQADNLHLDLWVKDKNILHDGGTYKYNSSDDDLKYFMGTGSHNAVKLDNFDQMEKGARFIWYHWTQCLAVATEETDEYFLFKGEISAFRHIDKNISQERSVKVFKNELKWIIEDTIKGKPKHMMLNQIWHTRYPELLTFLSVNNSGEPIAACPADGYYSDFYGKKETCSQLTFSTNQDSITTIISL